MFLTLSFQINKGNTTASEKKRNRDSGICSFESSDGKFGSLERARKSPTIHKCPSDIGPTIGNQLDSSVIYTQVRKTSTPGPRSSAKGKPASGSKKLESSSPQVAGRVCEKNGSLDLSLDDEKLFSEFERGLPLTSGNNNESLVDEIMSHLNSQIQNTPLPGIDQTSETQEHSEDTADERKTSENKIDSESCANISDNLETVDVKDPDQKNIISKAEIIEKASKGISLNPENDVNESSSDGTLSSKSQQNMSISAKSSSLPRTVFADSSRNLPLEGSEVKVRPGAQQNWVRRSSSKVKRKEEQKERLSELRTRLVQLKQDR